MRTITIQLLISLGILCSPMLNAANSGVAPLIQNLPGRQTMLLDGHWNYILDMYELGFYNYRMQEDPNGFFKEAKPTNPSDLVEYDFDKTETLNVPGDWNTQREDLLNYEGNIWYRKVFNYTPTPGKRMFVYFGSVNYECVAYLNGKKLGSHEGGFSSFNFEVTNQMQKGRNSLIVKVDNRRKVEAVPTNNTDWYNYGGITRSVHLAEVSETFIRDYFVQLKKGSDTQISGWVRLDGTQTSQKVVIEIPELKVKQTVQTDARGYATFEISAKPVLWSPDLPKLYEVHLSSETDQIVDLIGFRRIETSGKKILLNGKPIFLRGVSIHEEAPFRSGRAWSPEDAVTLLGWAKELGCNFVRLAHYQHNENMVRAAERMGFIVWSEIPTYWTIQWENAATLLNARTQLSEMISRDKNRANIAIWSICNETPPSEPRNIFLKTLADDARKLDNTRLIAAAMEKKTLGNNTQTIDDPLAEYLDVLSFNQYIGWYDGLPEKCDVSNWVFNQDKPILISEFGGGALQGFHGDKGERWTEEFQESLYQHSVAMFDRMEELSGTTPWILMDFRSPRRIHPEYQMGFNRKGLISDQGIKKKAFYVMQQWYQKKKKQEEVQNNTSSR